MTPRHVFRHRLAPVLLSLSLLLGACAAPTPTGTGAPVDAGTVAGTPAPVIGDAPPADRPRADRPSLGTGAPGGSVAIGRSCDTDADCTVKNVGNCCGYYPACVNVDSPTDPERVQAECASNGMASVCGFPEISSCQCVQGECQGSSRVLLE